MNLISTIWQLIFTIWRLLVRIFCPKKEILLVLPFPEEKPDFTQTLGNIDIDIILTHWLARYKVPPEFWYYWEEKIGITLDNKLPYPAATYELGGKRFMAIRPEWLNPGVIAHEQAHNSFALLREKERKEFPIVYNALREVNELIKLLYSINPYGLTSDIEGHAEVYRYLGYRMPEALKIYYPKLF